MLSLWEACLLGAVQGLTEFLPVSSSGHLAIMHHIVRPMPGAKMAAIDVALHVGTLAAVIAYFWRDLARMAGAVLGGRRCWERRWVGLLAVGSIPAGVLGFTIKEYIYASFGSLTVVGTCLLLTGGILFAVDRRQRGSRDADAVGVVDAFAIGCWQALALFPGISRSGATIAGGLVRGLDRDTAARFGFLLGIPAIVGAELSELGTLSTLTSDDLTALVAGMIVAGMTGLLAIGTLMQLVQSDRLHYFSYYLWPLGALVLAAVVVEGV